MNLFLDENFPKTALKPLSSKGFKVFDIRGTEFEGSDDVTLFKMAQDKKAIFLTTDKDFFHTIPHLYEQHFGVIVIAIRQPNRQSIIEKLNYILHYFDLSDIDSKVILLRDNHYTIR